MQCKGEMMTSTATDTTYHSSQVSVPEMLFYQCTNAKMIFGAVHLQITFSCKICSTILK